MGFRDNLREILDFSNMEQKELAAKTGLSLKTIENYVKRDSSVPSADKAVCIAQALGVTVEYLVLGNKISKENTPVIYKNIYKKHKEVIDILTKLNNSNYEIIISIAKTLLDHQKIKKSGKSKP